MSGRWVSAERAWYDSTVRHCAVCGCLIPGRAWIFAGADGELTTCGPSCEELYHSYWLPRHGAATAEGPE